MTSNQRRAAALAERIFDGTMEAAELSDSDWHLLLLASGLNKCHSIPLIVAARVLEQAGRRTGYFAARAERRERQSPPAETPLAAREEKALAIPFGALASAMPANLGPLKFQVAS